MVCGLVTRDCVRVHAGRVLPGLGVRGGRRGLAERGMRRRSTGRDTATPAGLRLSKPAPRAQVGPTDRVVELRGALVVQLRLQLAACRSGSHLCDGPWRQANERTSPRADPPSAGARRVRAPPPCLHGAQPQRRSCDQGRDRRLRVDPCLPVQPKPRAGSQRADSRALGI